MKTVFVLWRRGNDFAEGGEVLRVYSNGGRAAEDLALLQATNFGCKYDVSEVPMFSDWND
jgi:hypothetical protein